MWISVLFRLRIRYFLFLCFGFWGGRSYFFCCCLEVNIVGFFIDVDVGVFGIVGIGFGGGGGILGSCLFVLFMDFWVFCCFELLVLGIEILFFVFFLEVFLWIVLLVFVMLCGGFIEMDGLLDFVLISVVCFDLLLWLFIVDWFWVLVLEICFLFFWGCVVDCCVCWFGFFLDSCVLFLDGCFFDGVVVCWLVVVGWVGILLRWWGVLVFSLLVLLGIL